MSNLDGTAGKLMHGLNPLSSVLAKENYGQLKETFRIDVDGIGFDECAVYEKTCDLKDISSDHDEEHILRPLGDINITKPRSEICHSHKSVKSHSLNLPKYVVEECSLSDTDNKTPKIIQILESHHPQSLEDESSPSPEESVIIDLDDYCKDSDMKSNADEDGISGTILDETSETSGMHLHSNKSSPAQDFLSDKPRTHFTSVHNAKENSFEQLSIFDYDEREKVSPQQNACNDQSNAWEISSIFSNLKEYQYPFLDEGNISQVAQNIIPVSKSTTKSKSECQVANADSGVFDMSLCDMRVDSFTLENEITQPESDHFKPPCNTSDLDSAPHIFTNYSSCESTSSVAPLHVQSLSNIHKTTLSHGLHPPFPVSEIQPPNLSYCPGVKSAIKPENGSLFMHNVHKQPGYYCAPYPHYDSYYNQSLASSNYPPYTNHIPWPPADAANEQHVLLSDQSNSWYAPPSIANDGLMPDYVQYLSSNVRDDEETDDADEVDVDVVEEDDLDDIQVTFNETVPQRFASPGSVASSSCFSSPSPMLHEYSPSPLSQPPSEASTPGVENCKHDLHPWHHNVPPAMISHLDPTKTFCTPLAVQACPVTAEPVETGFLHYNLSQHMKRPFLSMADAMRSRTRNNKNQPKPYAPCGPRSAKNLIQSARISTSSKSAKVKKRSMKVKNECTTIENITVHSLEHDESLVSRSRHNEPLKQTAVDIMLDWFHRNVDNPYPSKADKEAMAKEGGITENQVKSWFANKRNRTNNTKPKVQKRAMEEKLMEVCQDLRRSNQNPMADNSRIIQQLSGIIQDYQTCKQETL